jgi:hypothetical protein
VHWNLKDLFFASLFNLLTSKILKTVLFQEKRYSFLFFSTTFVGWKSNSLGEERKRNYENNIGNTAYGMTKEQSKNKLGTSLRTCDWAKPLNSKECSSFPPTLPFPEKRELNWIGNTLLTGMWSSDSNTSMLEYYSQEYHKLQCKYLKLVSYTIQTCFVLQTFNEAVIMCMLQIVAKLVTVWGTSPQFAKPKYQLTIKLNER